MAVMMKCGHAANAKDLKTDGPCCAICMGIVKGADEVIPTPDLTGRTARCPSCKKTIPSSMELPFFHHRPAMEFDSYYCGCRGWD